MMWRGLCPNTLCRGRHNRESETRGPSLLEASLKMKGNRTHSRNSCLRSRPLMLNSRHRIKVLSFRYSGWTGNHRSRSQTPLVRTSKAASVGMEKPSDRSVALTSLGRARRNSSALIRPKTTSQPGEVRQSRYGKNPRGVGKPDPPSIFRAETQLAARLAPIEGLTSPARNAALQLLQCVGSGARHE